MFRITRRQALKVLGLIGALFGSGSAVSAKKLAPLPESGPLDGLESLDVKGLHCPPAINWAKDNEYTHNLFHGIWTWNADGTKLIDRDGTLVERSASNPDMYSDWMSHGRDNALDRFKKGKEQLARARQRVK